MPTCPKCGAEHDGNEGMLCRTCVAEWREQVCEWLKEQDENDDSNNNEEDTNG